MHKIDIKKRVAEAKAKAATMVAKRKRQPTVVLPEMTGDPEIDAQADLDAVKKGFRERMKNEAKRFDLATDSEYWFAVCFQTRDQKEAFLKAVELFEHGDKYLDGALVAEKLGVELPEADVPYLAEGKIDKDFAALAVK